jgi:diaminopimelate epimerase
MREIPFVKMHGLGNDFVFLDCLGKEYGDLKRVAQKLCERRFGVGADQLLTVHPSRVADFKMEIYNADGSQVEMCGNGIRCFAKYVTSRGLTGKKKIDVETLAGIIRSELVGDLVRVDMGEPILEAEKIPVRAKGHVRDEPLEVHGKAHRITCVSMGNPHCVVFLDGIDRLDLESVGPHWENHPFFPNRVSTEFVEGMNREEIRLRVWERGAGETLACGTGACAATVASHLTGRTERTVLVHMKGGDLRVEWDEESNRVFMTGPAVEVFQGTLLLAEE